MIVSQEGGLPVVVMLSTAELFLEHTSASALLSHIIHSPPVYSAAVLNQSVSHRWLFPSLLLTTLLSRD